MALNRKIVTEEERKHMKVKQHHSAAPCRERFKNATRCRCAVGDAHSMVAPMNVAPLLLLICVNAVNSLGTLVQAVTFFGGLLVMWPAWRLSRWLIGYIIVGYFVAELAVSWFYWGQAFPGSWVRSAKIIPFLVVMLLEWNAPSRPYATARSLPIYLRSYLALCIVNAIVGFALTGELMRGAVLLEYSIYASYTLAIVYYADRSRLTIVDKIVSFAVAVQLGSTMGLVLLAGAELFSARITLKRTLYLILASVPIGIVVIFLFQLRGRSVDLQDLAASDRGILITSSMDWMAAQMNVREWIVGHGAGNPLDKFVLLVDDKGFAGWLKQFQGGDGYIFSWGLHNEYIRIVIDYGIFGLLLCGLLLVRTSALPMLAVLGVGLMTNSYLYSYSGAIVVGVVLRRMFLGGVTPYRPATTIAFKDRAKFHNSCARSSERI